jgi:hypothetical protein
MQDEKVMTVERFDEIMLALTPHRIRLLEAIYSFENRWASRLQLALALGKRRLNPFEHQSLVQFIDMGLIEVELRPIITPITDHTYYYRVPDHIADLMQEWVEWRKTNRNKPIPRKRKPINIMEQLEEGARMR